MPIERHSILHRERYSAGMLFNRAARLKARAGFTLVEIIIVMAIIAILAAIAIPAYASYVKKARIARCITELRILEREILAFSINNNHLPVTLADVGYGNLVDPWGNQYQYLNIADGTIKGKGKLRKDRFVNPLNSDFDLYSVGEDGLSKAQLNAKESRDDIVRANNGGFVGLAADF